MTRIKQLRKLLDYTQAKMASQLGVARSTVSMWEVSDQEPDYDTLKKITLLYHVPADYVMGRGIFTQWDDIIKYYDEVSFTLIEMIPPDFMLPVFSDEKYLRAWIDTRLYTELDELDLIRFFAFAIDEINLYPVEPLREYDHRVEVDVTFTKEFAALIRLHDPTSEPKVIRASDLASRMGNLLADAEKEMVRKYRSLDDYGKETVDYIMERERLRVEQIRSLTSSAEDNVIPFTRSLQKSRLPASAGTGVYLGPEDMEIINVMENDLTRRASFCVPVSGDSMEPTYHDGDVLLVEGCEDIEIGQIGVFTVDGDGYVKKRGDGELISLNPDYDPIPLTEDSWCNGLVIGVLDPAWIADK